MKNSTKKTKNSNLAIPTDAPARPPNPSTAAINAITKKVIAQPNMDHLPFFCVSTKFDKHLYLPSIKAIGVPEPAAPSLLFRGNVGHRANGAAKIAWRKIEDSVGQRPALGHAVAAVNTAKAGVAGVVAGMRGGRC